MAWTTNSMATYACALTTFIWAGVASAQTPPPTFYLPQYPAHISINGAPSSEFEIVPVGAPTGTPAVAHCTAYCDFWALPGKYTLYALDHSTGERKELSLRIKKSSRYVFEPGDDRASSGGLVLGIAGSAAFLTGFFMVMPALMSAMCEDSNCSSKAEQNAAAAGLWVMLAGVAATPVGFIIYGSNRTRLNRIEGEPYAASEEHGNVRVGIVGVGRGAFGLGGVATF